MEDRKGEEEREKRNLDNGIGSMKENFSTCLFLNTNKRRGEEKIKRKERRGDGDKKEGTSTKILIPLLFNFNPMGWGCVKQQTTKKITTNLRERDEEKERRRVKEKNKPGEWFSCFFWNKRKEKK